MEEGGGKVNFPSVLDGHNEEEVELNNFVYHINLLSHFLIYLIYMFEFKRDLIKCKF